MSHSVLLALLVASSSLASARHVHQKPEHGHVARQAVAIPSPIAAPVAPVVPPTANNDISEAAAELDACLNSIPDDIAAIMGAIDQRLADVQSQVASLLNGNLPGLPGLPTPSVPALPVNSVSIPRPFVPSDAVPAVSIPALPNTAVPSISIPALPTTAVPPFNFPLLSIPLPTINFVPSLGPIAPSAVASVSSPAVPTGVPALPVFSLPLPAPALSSGLPQAPSIGLPIPVASLNTGLPVPTNLPAISTPRVSVSTVPTAIPTQFINSIPRSFTTVVPSSRAPVSIPSSTSYVFNADARDNLAVYFGNTAATASRSLAELCQNRNVDIVVLSFVFDFFSANGYPSIYFGTPSCSGQTAAQVARGPGLRNCPTLAQQITGCQAAGKKVLVSLGGYVANSTLPSDVAARQFASTLWNLFGAGVGPDTDLRPFGSNVVVDGFDIDNEDHSTAHWEAFASAMRALFNSDSSRRYYLSAAPQCPFPDASIPIGVLQHADFVWPQFYNNPSCNLDTAGFQASFQTWSNSLLNSSLPTQPKLYIGAPAFPGAGTGYVNGANMSTRITLATSLQTKNFGGIMLWDGSEGLENTDSLGKTYLDYSKWSLQNR